MANELAIKILGDAKDASQAFLGLREDAETSFGGIETASESAQKSLGLNVNAFALGSVAAGSALEGLARSQQENTVQARQLAASLGISEDAVRDMAAGMADAGFPLEDALDLMELGRQRGITSAEELKKYAGFWDTVADATGGAGPALAESGVALQQIGIAAGNEAEALAAFGYVTENTTQGVDEFLNFVNRAGPDLKDMGLNIDQTAGLLGAMETELGLTGRVARQQFNEAIVESGGDLGKMLETLGLTEEQLAEYTAAVGESSGVIERNAAITNEAFTPLQQMQAQFKNLVFQHGALIGEAAKLAPLLMGMGPLLKGAQMATKGFAVAQAGLNLVMAMNPIMLVVIALVALGAGLVLAYKKSETFRAIVDSAFGAVRDTALAVVGVITDDVIPFFTETLPGVFTGLKDAVTGIFTGIKDFLFENWKSIVAGVLTILFPSGAGIYYIITHFDEIKAKAVEIWDGIKARISELATEAKDLVVGAVEGLRNRAAEILDEIRTKFETIWGGIKDFVAGIWEGITSIPALVNTGIDKVKGKIDEVLGQIKEIWDGAWNGLLSKIKSLWSGEDSVLATVKDGISDVKDQFLDAPTWLVNAGGDLIQGFINGIKGAASGLAKAVKDYIIDAVKNEIKTGFGLFSPSRVMMEYGRDSGAGFAVGMQQSLPMVAGAARSLVDTTTDAITASPAIMQARTVLRSSGGPLVGSGATVAQATSGPSILNITIPGFDSRSARRFVINTTNGHAQEIF